jgi:hypothetical protein
MDPHSRRHQHLPQLPADVAQLCEEFQGGLESALGDSFASFYIFGALAFPRPDGWLLDVDFHVLLYRRITEAEGASVKALHEHLAAASRLGAELDGYYIQIEDAKRSEPPTSQVWAVQDGAWALHRAHVLAGRFFLLSGIDPRRILSPPVWPELRVALEAEMRFIRDHPEHAAFGILNGCRVLWSVRNREVVISKFEAAQWALGELPFEWREVIAAALRFYTQTASEEDCMLLHRRHSDFLILLDGALVRRGGD